MSRRVVWTSGAILAVVLVLGVLISLMYGGPSVAGPSTLSRRSPGWLGACRWLEAHDTIVQRTAIPFSTLPAHGTLVLAFPAQRAYATTELDAIDSFVRGGGAVVFAYSLDRPSVPETQAAAALGLELVGVDDEGPLAPWAWLRWARQTWSLEPAGSDHPEQPEQPEQPVVITAPHRLARVPQETQTEPVLQGGPDAEPMVLSYRRGRGRVLAMPAEALANGRLSNLGNLALLEALRATFDEPWIFDEHRHGLSAELPASSHVAARTFDLLAAHLLLCYLMAVLALARRFGPPWREAPITIGSTSRFLVALGRVHERMGHHERAATLLLERARKLDPDLELSRAEEAETDLLRLAATIGHKQRRPAG